MKARYVEIRVCPVRGFEWVVVYHGGEEEGFGGEEGAGVAHRRAKRDAEALGIPLFATTEAQVALDRAGAFRAEASA